MELRLSALALVLCFGTTSAVDKACPFKPADLIFLLDASGSEGSANFNKQLTFVKNFTDQFEIGLNNTRVSLVTFATTVHNVMYLNQNLNKSQVMDAITNTKYTNGETNTHLGLKWVSHQTLANRHDGRNVSKIVIVLTDGRSIEPALTKHEAVILKNKPLVEVIAIGIGADVDPAELLVIASDSNHTFQVVDFDALSSIQEELTDTTCNVCKNDMSDICFVLDSSGSEGSRNFLKQLEFVNMVVNEFSFEGTDATKLCVITFGTNAYTEIRLNSFHTNADIQANVLKIPYRNGETQTDKGLANARGELFNSHHGARLDSNKVVIVLTDGRSTEPTWTASQAKNLQRRGVDMFAVGIGNHVDGAELNIIASDHDHVLQIDSFDKLDTIHQNLVDKICAKSSLHTTHAPTTTPLPTTTPKPTTTPVPTTTTTLPPTTTKAECGLKPADIVFVLDSSDSEGAENFQKEIDFVHSFAAQFSIGTKNVQFSVLTFSSAVRNDFYFNTYHSRNAVLHAIRNIQYIGQGTNTSAALAFVREHNLTPKYGARTNSSKFVIVITDGRSDEPDQTKVEANRLHHAAQVISIGVGPKVDQEELKAIASNHHAVQVDSFAVLHNIQNQLTDLACESG